MHIISLNFVHHYFFTRCSSFFSVIPAFAGFGVNSVFCPNRGRKPDHRVFRTPPTLNLETKSLKAFSIC
ncbi:Uncharacterized protein dnm_058560 [Desulfonema magnum]|uniref:Uncharacterized protein n=1 Tax=Desulfonema magnum TaxID=45655 RepID=A0A975BRB9_9BACT|nr:Uncharacterized protein dnm_058560 [Desulfonema magnum]